MSAVSRMMKNRQAKSQAAQVAQSTNDQTQPQTPYTQAPTQSYQSSATNDKKLYDVNKQQNYEAYNQYIDYNPTSFQFSTNCMPYNLSLYNNIRVPLTCFASPVNQDLQYTQQSAKDIPRCTSCRAYMNYYNTATNRGFKCFLCGRQNTYQIDYSPDNNGIQLQQPSYLVDGAQGYYNTIPPENTYIFLVDVSKQAAQCKMLSYIVSVMKDILTRQDLNETQIYFYTYDDTVHQYSFSGDQIERTILDPTIKTNPSRQSSRFLEEIRDKLLQFLDCLEQIAQKNTRQSSHFYQVFQYVYENIKHTGGKMFVFQANEAIIGQQFANQNYKPANNPPQTQKIKSLVQTKNKIFFNRFVQVMLNDNISMSLFVFGRVLKNLKVFADTCKLSNSQLLYYSKDSPQDLTRFYYQFYHLLGATYYIDTRIELIISAGWYYTAVYGNLYRLKQYITFKFCHYQRSKKICAIFLPQQGFCPSPAFSMQIVTNYIYGRKHYMSVNTAVLPFTTNIDRLFQSINIQNCQASIFKTYLSSLRLQDIATVKNKYLRQCSSLWKAFHDYYKGKFSPQIRGMFLSFLGFLKNHHTQIDIINGNLLMDKIIWTRNVLQSCNYPQVASTFAPYLFNLAMDKDRCQQQNFTYPDVCQLRFSQIKQGLFLMDAGSTLYLYLSKNCHPNYYRSLFGKQKFAKNEILSQQLITQQDNHYSRQVIALINVLRQSKTYGWIPLVIVRCGQSSLNQKNFYLNFYQQKYQEFRSYKLTYEEFISILSTTM